MDTEESMVWCHFLFRDLNYGSVVSIILIAARIHSQPFDLCMLDEHGNLSHLLASFFEDVL